MKRFLAIAAAVLLGTIITTGVLVKIQMTVVDKHQLEQKK